MCDKVVPVYRFNNGQLKIEEIVQERISFISADIEGEELSLLKSMKHIIEKDRHVIAVCMYHKREDFVEIPLYIRGIVDDYEFILRKYESDSYRDVLNCWEVVLYAIPTEKALNA